MPRDQKAAGEGVAQGTIAILRQRHRNKDRHDGRQGKPWRATGPDGRTSRGNEDEDRQEGAHETATPRCGPMGHERDVQRGAVVQDLGSEVQCHPAGSGRQEQRAPAFGAAP